MTRQLALIHLAGNALLLLFGYYWLGIGESRAATLAWSGMVLVALVCLTCTLHGATFLSLGGAGFRPALRTTARNLLPILVVVLAALAIYLLLAQWADYSQQPAYRIASWLTLKLRKPVKPAAVMRVFNAVLWLIEWAAIPVFLLPVLSAVSARGWRGLRLTAPSRRYWIQAPILLLLALWVPLKLVGWTAYRGSFGLEMFSFILRAVTAYLLFVAAWLALAFATVGAGFGFSGPGTKPS